MTHGVHVIHAHRPDDHGNVYANWQRVRPGQDDFGGAIGWQCQWAHEDIIKIRLYFIGWEDHLDFQGPTLVQSEAERLST